LGTIIEKSGRIDKEKKRKNRKSFLRIRFLAKKKIPKEIRNQGYQKAIRPFIVYGSESWTVTKNNKRNIAATEIKGITRRDRIRDETELNL
jgi:hypothetical protein